MYIDGCTHSFRKLTSTVLPAHLSVLRRRLRAPWKAGIFCEPSVGPAAIAAKLGLDGDFAGLYVFATKGKPFYVGISRKVISRVRQHLFTESHYSASLAYLMASNACKVAGKRAARMSNAQFLSQFRRQQAFMRRQHVAAIPVANPLELHLLEAYVAMALGTSKWNSFRTH